MTEALVIVEGASVPCRKIDELVRNELQTELSECTISDAGVLNSQQKHFKKALYFASKLQSVKTLSLFLGLLEPGALVAFCGVNKKEREVFRRNCVFSGFLVLEDASDEDLLRAKKPEWAVGAKSEVKTQPSSKWTLDVEDDEVLDDDAFLTEEDLQPAPEIQGGKAPVKKACDNCTCGRAEGKEPVKLTQEMVDNPVTNCGSCGLGDAYRCASCPYRGLPSFEPGKKIELPEGFLISDL